MEEAVQSLLRYGYWDSLPAKKACEEFMQLATIAHVMSAAIQIAGVTNMSDCPQRLISLWQR